MYNNLVLKYIFKFRMKYEKNKFCYYNIPFCLYFNLVTVL